MKYYPHCFMCVDSVADDVDRCPLRVRVCFVVAIKVAAKQAGEQMVLQLEYKPLWKLISDIEPKQTLCDSQSWQDLGRSDEQRK